MPEDEFRTDLRWPTDPLGEREGGPGDEGAAADEEVERVSEVWTGESRAPVLSGADRSSRFVVEAYDRLADRVLERLRALRVDLDSDLAEIRSEMATLRQAVDDVGDRVQLRQLRSSIDELRGDVSGLRRSVLEWPELERVSSDVAALRADVTNLLAGRTPARAAGPADPAAVASLHEVVDDLRAAVDSLSTVESMADALTELREEVASLRRRITLRGKGGGSATLTDDQLDRLADALIERGVIPSGRPRR